MENKSAIKPEFGLQDTKSLANECAALVIVGIDPEK